MAIAIENNDPQTKHRYRNLPDSDGCGVHCELLRQYHFPVSSSFREFQFWQEWHWAQRTKQSSDPTAAKGHCGTRLRARRCTFTRVSGNVPRPDLATYSSSFIFVSGMLTWFLDAQPLCMKDGEVKGWNEPGPRTDALDPEMTTSILFARKMKLLICLSSIKAPAPLS